MSENIIQDLGSGRSEEWEKPGIRSFYIVPVSQ
jgi:hypothetical protein